MIRHGVRVGRPTLVVHAWRRDAAETPGVTRVGFVVSRSVGGAVVRNRVKRRLRALSRPLVMACPAEAYSVVVRALPGVAGHSARLGDDLAGAWASAWTKAGVA